MRKLYWIIIILGALFLLALMSGGDDDTQPPASSTAISLGSSYSPANIPSSSIEDIQNLFVLLNDIDATHMQFGTSWGDEAQIQDIKTIQIWTKNANLDFHLFLSPLLFEDRTKLSLPLSVGGNSFTDEEVRTAFKQKALEFASLKPEILGIGTEVNLLYPNIEEYQAFKALAKETYDLIKQQYPNQRITISFHYDPIFENNQFNLINDFIDSSDIISLTTYPNTLGSPASIPSDYYAKVKRLYPNEKFSISEVGWGTIPNNNAQWQIQADFFSKLPSLVEELEPEFVTLASMHDTDVFTGEIAGFNYLGIRTLNSQPKPAWDVIKNYE